MLTALTLVFLSSCSWLDKRIHTPSSQGDRYTSQLSKGSPCFRLTTELLAGKSESLFARFKREKLAPLLERISSYSTKSKMQMLKLLHKRVGKTKFITEMYAETLNQMLNKKLISVDQVPDLLTVNSHSRYLLDFSYQEVRVLERELLDFPNVDQTMDILIRQKGLRTNSVIQLRKLLNESDLNLRELKVFRENFKTPQTKQGWKDLQEYLTYSNALRDKKKLKALEEVRNLVEGKQGQYTKKFRSLQKSVNQYKDKQYRKQLKKISKTEKNGAVAKRLAREEAERMTEVYSHLKYACRSAKPTDTTKRAAKATSGFFMATGLAATMGTYAYANWDKDKGEFDWYGKLGHDLAWKFIFQFGYNLIMTDPAATMLKKTISLHIFYTPADAIEASMYEWEFGEDNSFIDEEYERLKQQFMENDPEFAKNYNELVEYMGKEYVGDKIKGFFKAVFSGEVKLPKNEVDEILIAEDLTREDLDDEELQERLMEAIAVKVYDQNSGRVKLGSQFLDRYVFVRTYDILDVPRSLLVGLWIYRTMCMGGNNMHQALIKASTIYVLDQIIGKYMYYQIRRDVINM